MDVGLHFGPYEILSRLAMGGMGEVYIAKRSGVGAFEKRVALKVMLPHLAEDAEFRQRFFDEARLAARMEHPNLVQIFDVGETDGRPWLAMALIEGVSLSRLMKAAAESRVSLPLPIVRYVATGLLEALTYAHGIKGKEGEWLGVIHRDVTPSNVLLSSSGAVLLNDFGIAKAHSNSWRTQPGVVRGKVAYVAPEQVLLLPVTQRADLFSAGVTLFEAVTGVSPFARDGQIDTAKAIATSATPDVATLRPEADAAMMSALNKALEKVPEARFASARAMREAFVRGPVATAPELADLVQAWCADDLAVFGGGDTTEPVHTATGSLPSQPLQSAAAVVLASEPTDRVWWLKARPAVAVVAVLALAVAGVLVAALWPSSPPQLSQQHPVAEPPDAAIVPVSVASRVLVPSTPDAAGGEEVRAPATPQVEMAPQTPKLPLRPKLPAPPAVKPAVETYGLVTIDAKPWAHIYIDDVRYDVTPSAELKLPAGPHQLELRFSSGEVRRETMLVVEGQLLPIFRSPP